MAAPAPRSASGTGEEKHITISPATSNENVDFTHDFDKLFRASTLQAAFEKHPAFTAIFQNKKREFVFENGGFGRYDDSDIRRLLLLNLLFSFQKTLSCMLYACT